MVRGFFSGKTGYDLCAGTEYISKILLLSPIVGRFMLGFSYWNRGSTYISSSSHKHHHDSQLRSKYARRIQGRDR